MKKRVVLIGAGGSIAGVYKRALAQSADFYLGCSIDPGKNIHSEVLLYRSFNEFRDKDVADVAMIVSPPQTHATLAIAALEAGLDTLVEKTPAQLITDCRCMVDAVKQQVLFFSWHAQYATGVDYLRRCLASETIVSVDIIYREDVRWFRLPGTISFHPGAVWDSGINALSVLTHLLPELQWEVVQALLTRPEHLPVDTAAEVQLIASSVRCRFSQKWMYPDLVRTITVTTDQHTWVLDIHNSTLKQNGAVVMNGQTDDPMLAEYKAQIKHFADCVKRRKSYTHYAPVELVSQIHQASEAAGGMRVVMAA